MLFRRFYHDRLAQAGYLIACQAAHEAIVVDPLRDPAPYLDAARQEDVRITHVTETHIHADFLSGASALAQAAGAELLLSGEGSGAAGYDRSAYPRARWLHDGDRLQVGHVRLDVMHVPGHTPEHLAFVVTDTATSDDPPPLGLVSGDFLFVGDVGRPDLLERVAGVQGTMAKSARQLFASLQRLAALPDYLQIWPGHGAGSACGKALGAVPQSTLGYERRTNWALGVRSESDFVTKVLAGQPEPPAYFARMKKLNATGVPTLAAVREMHEADLRRVIDEGGMAVDVRPPEEFAAGHLRHSINVPLGNSFLSWAGSVIPADRDVVLVASLPLRAEAGMAMHQLHLIGLNRVLGVLAPERVSTLTSDALRTLPSVGASTLGGKASPGMTVLDVRNRSEWDEGHVPGARHLPLAELTARLDELRDRGPIVVHCQGGSRSAVAASVLAAAGFDDVKNVVGGYAAWVGAGNTPATGE
jgi:hydroxyacylglutathione hydrolase